MTIDNNASERTLRHQAIGHKNWLFLGSRDAGPRAAVLYTILAGAKRHRTEPWTYVRELLMRLHADDDRLEDMLPDHWAAQHPEAVLTYRLDESRNKAAVERDRRRRRRAQPKSCNFKRVPHADHGAGGRLLGSVGLLGGFRAANRRLSSRSQNRLNLVCPPRNKAGMPGLSNDREGSKNTPWQSNLCSRLFAHCGNAVVTMK